MGEAPQRLDLWICPDCEEWTVVEGGLTCDHEVDVRLVEYAPATPNRGAAVERSLARKILIAAFHAGDEYSQRAQFVPPGEAAEIFADAALAATTPERDDDEAT